jgi:hypothetical protein
MVYSGGLFLYTVMNLRVLKRREISWLVELLLVSQIGSIISKCPSVRLKSTHKRYCTHRKPLVSTQKCRQFRKCDVTQRNSFMWQFPLYLLYKGWRIIDADEVRFVQVITYLELFYISVDQNAVIRKTHFLRSLYIFVYMRRPRPTQGCSAEEGIGGGEEEEKNLYINVYSDRAVCVCVCVHTHTHTHTHNTNSGTYCYAEKHNY